MTAGELRDWLDQRIARMEAITATRKGTNPLTHGQQVELAVLREVRDRLDSPETPL